MRNTDKTKWYETKSSGVDQGSGGKVSYGMGRRRGKSQSQLAPLVAFEIAPAAGPLNLSP